MSTQPTGPDTPARRDSAEAVADLARTLWDADHADLPQDWRDMAWADMGGSEPSEGRVEYELQAAALLADAGRTD